MGAHGEAIVQLRDARDFDPRTGWTTIARWSGTAAAIITKAAEYELQGIRCSIIPGTTRDELRAYLGGEVNQPPSSETLRDEWELDANELQPSLWQLPKVKTELDKFSADQISIFRGMVQCLLDGRSEYTYNDVSYTVTLANIISWITVDLELGGPGEINTTIISGFITSLLKDVEYFPDSQWVLHRVKVYASNADVRASRTNVNRIFDTAGLVKAEGIPSDVKFQLEDGFWLKKAPRLKRISYGRWQITQEYWFAEAYNSFSIEAAE